MLGDEPGVDIDIPSNILLILMLIFFPAGLNLIFVLTGKKAAPKYPIDCVRAGCDRAGTMLNKNELQVFHTVVDNIEMA